MEPLKLHILRNLYRRAYIGSKYLPIEELKWGLPTHEKSMKKINKAVKELVKEGYLILHKKGTTVSINPRMIKEVREIIQTQSTHHL
jgi:hypothetical protein